MNEYVRRIVSVALAGTVVSGASALEAKADCVPTDTYVIEHAESDEDHYVVQQGDTLGGIATLYFGNPDYYVELAKYNHIENPCLIYEGQVILIPKTLSHLFVAGHPKEYAEDELYEVQQGDYMLKIVKEFYESEDLRDVDKLATYNNLADPNLINVGQVLRIPEKDKLANVVANDYTLQYQMLEWRIEHPGEPYPQPYIDSFIWCWEQNPGMYCPPEWPKEWPPMECMPKEWPPKHCPPKDLPKPDAPKVFVYKP